MVEECHAPPILDPPARRDLGGLVVAAATAPIAGAAPTNAGFKTAQGAMMVLGPGAGAGSSVTPLLTVGDTVDGFSFEAIPDGISLDPHGKGSLSLFINHETSTVPFPYVLPPRPPTHRTTSTTHRSAR